VKNPEEIAQQGFHDKLITVRRVYRVETRSLLSEDPQEDDYKNPDDLTRDRRTRPIQRR